MSEAEEDERIRKRGEGKKEMEVILEGLAFSLGLRVMFDLNTRAFCLTGTRRRRKVLKMALVDIKLALLPRSTLPLLLPIIASATRHRKPFTLANLSSRRH